MSHDKQKALEEDPTDVESFIASLVVEFPQLDESLIRAITSDHSLSDPTEKESVQELLHQLADGASESWFKGDKPAEIWKEAILEETTQVEKDTSQVSDKELSKEEQLAELQLIFSHQSTEKLQQTLQECDNNFNRALDVLINEDFLATEQSTSGTSTPKGGKKKRRQRGKKKSNSNNSSSESLVDIPTIVPHYKPVRLEEQEEGWIPTAKRSTASASHQSSSSSSSAAEHASVAHAGFTKAAHYARLGRSNPLFNSAAAFYSSNARQALDSARLARFEESSTRVARLAVHNPRLIDLHGISTADAKRIAVERTRMWWEGLGEKRLELMNGEAWKKKSNSTDSWLVIIVGKGTHSAGQRGVLGPAVMKALQDDGWKFEDEIGQAGRIIVKGKILKRK